MGPKNHFEDANFWHSMDKIEAPKFTNGPRNFDHALLEVVCPPKADTCCGLHVNKNFKNLATLIPDI